MANQQQRSQDIGRTLGQNMLGELALSSDDLTSFVAYGAQHPFALKLCEKILHASIVYIFL